MTKSHHIEEVLNQVKRYYNPKDLLSDHIGLLLTSTSNWTKDMVAHNIHENGFTGMTWIDVYNYFTQPKSDLINEVTGLPGTSLFMLFGDAGFTKQDFEEYALLNNKEILQELNVKKLDPNEQIDLIQYLEPWLIQTMELKELH